MPVFVKEAPMQSSPLVTLTVPQLRKASAWRHIKCTSRLRKAELIKLIIHTDAVRTLQRSFRRRGPRVCNSTDPITMGPVGDVGRCFCYTTNNGERIAYSPEPLAKYIIATGNGTDPMTRETYSNEDSRRLQNQAPAVRHDIAARAFAPPSPNEVDDIDIRMDGSAVLDQVVQDLLRGIDDASRGAISIDELMFFVYIAWVPSYFTVLNVVTNEEPAELLSANERVMGTIESAVHDCGDDHLIQCMASVRSAIRWHLGRAERGA
jgi:hypothetical protein